MFVEAISVSNLCFKFIYHKGCLALCWLYVINEILREEQCSNSNVQRKKYKVGAERHVDPLMTGHTHQVPFVVIEKTGIHKIQIIT